MARCFRERVVFPEEVTRGLSDEQYVRNVVDTLYRRQFPEALLEGSGGTRSQRSPSLLS